MAKSVENTGPGEYNVPAATDAESREKDMTEKLRKLIIKYKEQILYVVFGGLTTLINWGTYALCCDVMGIPNLPSVAIAWILSVAFAFVTNKIWVFESRSFDRKTLLRELWTFTSARLATLLLDMGIMYLAVNVMGGNHLVWKLISNVIVIILNYVLSKLVVFRKQDKPDEEDKK